MNQATSTNCIFPVTNFTQLKDKVLNWANQFGTFCFLDNHQYSLPFHSEECILAVGIADSVSADAGNALDQLQDFISRGDRWIFGHLGYDLKNEIENLQSSHPDHIGFPDLFFFQPQVLIAFDTTHMTIESDTESEDIFQEILAIPPCTRGLFAGLNIRSRLTREQYIRVTNRLRQHIIRGDCYEINFCQEFFSENANVDPVAAYRSLSAISPNPFSALYKLEDKYLICASPERFLKRSGQKIVSQPIKGTASRAVNDDQARANLFNSSKDRSENVMIVDLVRNDLSRICLSGSVAVDELFGIYSFPQVHQMVSTITGTMRDDVDFSDVVRATFPMGSMTGAPKKRVLGLIEEYETTRRGIFSGAVGYIDPRGDFDFNVVIRSIMYNGSSRYVSYQAGSAITFYSNAAKEWEECLLKAEAIRKVLDAQVVNCEL